MKQKNLAIYLLLSVSVRAFAWSEGNNNDFLLDCDGLKMSEADSVVVRVFANDGSYGTPKLVGLKEGKPIWTRTFPKTGAVNAAKLDVQCRGKILQLADSNPGDSNYFVQRFIWDGKTLKHLKDYPPGRPIPALRQ